MLDRCLLQNCLNNNTGDGIDYGQRHNNDIGENVLKTLELMEEHGGAEAYKSIKFSIPLYESCMRSKVIQRAGTGEGVARTGKSNAGSTAASARGGETSTAHSGQVSIGGSRVGSKSGSKAGSVKSSR